MAQVTRAQTERHDPLGDDYLIDGEGGAGRPRPIARIARGLQAILFVVLAILSLALFWVVGLMLGIL